MEAFTFSQDVEPPGWNPALYGHAEWPMTVLLVDRLPSAHRSQANYKVAILYRPTNLPSAYIPNNWLGYPGESGHIKAVCCGPSDDHGCIVGARIEPCAHGATALKLGCVIPLQQNSFRSTHRDLNIVDPGNRLPLEYARDLYAGAVN